MAVPKQRHTKSRRDRRRANIKLRPVNYIHCEKCSAPVPPHIICENCGTYKGREMIDVLKKLSKKDNKAKRQESNSS